MMTEIPLETYSHIKYGKINDLIIWSAVKWIRVIWRG